MSVREMNKPVERLYFLTRRRGRMAIVAGKVVERYGKNNSLKKVQLENGEVVKCGHQGWYSSPQEAIERFFFTLCWGVANLQYDEAEGMATASELIRLRDSVSRFVGRECDL